MNFPKPIVMLSVAALLGCGQNAATPSAEAAAQAPAAVVAAEPTTPAATPVDACALLAKVDAEAVLGALLSGPTAHEPQGSLLGQCDYLSSRGLVTVSARPAVEFEPTVQYAGRQSPAEAVAGLGASAFHTRYGLMVQPQGARYFVVVLAMAGTAHSPALALDIGRRLKL